MRNLPRFALVCCLGMGMSISCEPEKKTTTDEPVICGGVTCTTSVEGLESCCTLGEDKCGHLLFGLCVDPTSGPGFADDTCPQSDYGTACCTSEGQCGFRANALDMCIPAEDVGDAPQSCDNICERQLPLPCDGPEDCPDDTICCGKYESTFTYYTFYGCFPSDECTGASGDYLFRLCHTDSDCLEEEFCLRSTYVPTGIARCYTVGVPVDRAPTEGILCGSETETCDPGGKCCLDTMSQLEAICVGVGERCPCMGE